MLRPRGFLKSWIPSRHHESFNMFQVLLVLSHGHDDWMPLGASTWLRKPPFDDGQQFNRETMTSDSHPQIPLFFFAIPACPSAADYDPDLCGGVVFEDRVNQRCRMGKSWISLSKIGSSWDFLGTSRGQYNQLQKVGFALTHIRGFSSIHYKL